MTGRRRAINQDVVEGLVSAFADARENPDVWAVILTGAGDVAFSAGADLKAMERSAGGPDQNTASIRRGPRVGVDDLHQHIRH